MSFFARDAYVLVLLNSLLSVNLLADENTDSTLVNAEPIRISSQPRIIITLQPDHVKTHGAFEQEQILLTLSVASKYPFDALNVEFPAIDDAEQISLALPRTRKITSYAGEGYVHERRFALFSNSSGELKLPDVSVSGLLATEGKTQTEFSDEHSGFAIKIKPKPISYEDDWWMISSNIEIQESWSVPLDEIREGEIVTRTVTLRATGVDEKRLPTLSHGRTQGITVRELDTNYQTIKSSQGLVAIMNKSWSLKVERPDIVYISPVGVAYWDTIEQRRIKKAAPGHRIEPLAADSEAIAQRVMSAWETDRQTAYKFIVGSLMLLLTPPLVIFIHGLFHVLSFFRDRQFKRQFLRADTDQIAYRAWFDWSSLEDCQSNTKWQALNSDFQRTIFSMKKPEQFANRAELLKLALQVMRKHRLVVLRRKYSQLSDLVIGNRKTLYH
ncbi:MAG: hypothetical protein AB8B79_05280 [Granulosicoccus sp.]